MTTRQGAGRAFLALLGAAIPIDGSVSSALAQQTAPAQQATPAPQPRTSPAQAKKSAAKSQVQTQPAAKPPAQSQPVAQSQPNIQPQQAAPAQTVFDEHIRQGKIVTCAKTFSALGRSISENFSYTAQSQWNAEAGNNHAIQSLVALKPPPNAPMQQSHAGIVFAAPVGSSCEGHLVRVTPVPQSCPDVAGLLAKTNGQNSAFGELSVSAMPNGSQVILIPFEKACIAVTVLRGAG